MTSWKEERDRLVAQTLAFVQRVTAANPGASQSHAILQSLQETTAIPAAPEVTVTPTTPAPTDSPPPVAVSLETGAQSSADPAPRLLTAAMLTNHALYSTASVRADIGQRVAAFKARQSQIGREREAYYETMQARIRTTLGNDSSSDRL